MTIRLWQHQNGLGAKHTAKRLPVELVYVEVFDRIDEAFWREKQVQGWSRKKKEALMASDFNQLHLLAECQNETHSRSLSGDADFDFAQPTDGDRSLREVEGKSSECGGVVGFDFAQPTDGDRSLSEVEGNIGTGNKE